MATVRHRRWWASTARLWPRRSGSAARGTEREQISLVDVADASFMMPLSMEETTPAPPSTGMGSSARSCGRPRLPSSGDRGRSDCPSCRSRGNACCALQSCRFRWKARPAILPVQFAPRARSFRRGRTCSAPWFPRQLFSSDSIDSVSGWRLTRKSPLTADASWLCAPHVRPGATHALWLRRLGVRDTAWPEVVAAAF